MEIYWLGHGCFRIRGRDATVVTDPCPPSTGYKIGKVPADIVTMSRDHADSSYRQAISGEPKYVSSPGEYEIAGVLMTGVRTDHEARQAGAPSRNVAYVLDLDDIRVCHLGSISKRPVSDDVEALGTPDVLIIPVGGGQAFDAQAAAETVSLLEPKIVIPMQYKTEAAVADLEPVDKFLKEMGSEGKTAEARLSLTKSNIPQDTTIVLLSYRG
jgi:L-ascorbate metabolism protein UlaG (beta-lactamase superfamily)